MNKLAGISVVAAGAALVSQGAHAGGVIYEDLYMGNVAGGYVHQGYFTFDHANDLLTFTAIPVPEPAAYGMLAGAGLLALSLRSEFHRKTA